MSAEADFEFVDDVTSDVCFVARGATLSEVFAAAAEALLAATLDEPGALRETRVRRVELAEPDLELLLLRFLNELVYLRDAEGLLLRARTLRVEADPTQARLVGELTGEPIDRPRHRLAADVKAATAHGLELASDPRGFRAKVTLDV